MTACPDCRSTHLGSRCGMTFAQRMRTVTIHPDATPTRTRALYYDREALAQSFGADAREQALEDTDGLGPAMEDSGGGLWRRDRRTCDIVPVTEGEIDKVYLGGEEVDAGEELEGLD